MTIRNQVTVQDLRDVLVGLGIEPTPDELADVLWLAMLDAVRPEGKPGTAGTAPAARHRSPAAPRSPGPDPEGGHASGGSRTEKTRHGSATGDDRLHVRLPDRESPRSPAPVPVATNPALPAPLSLARALRPMRRHRVPGPNLMLDEVATADLAAEQHLWLPVLKPVSEPALDLALVIDVSESMQLWTGLARELRALCDHLGTFRHIQTWHLVPPLDGHRAGPAVRGAAPSSPLHDPGEVLDPSGRRLILVLTDGVHPAWRPGGPMRPVLARWSAASPVAIVQALPQRLWDRTWIRTSVADFHQNGPGTCSARLVRPQRRLPGSTTTPEPNEAVAPVLELTPDVLGRWARLVIGAGGAVRLAAVPLTAQADGNLAAQARDDVLGGIADAGPADPAELVRAFRKSVSPAAYQLAGHLSVVAPLTLPVMRLVMESTVPGAGSAELAEVFLGGLLRRLAGQPDDGPDHVMYGFAAGVRDELWPSITRHEALTVLDQVGTYLETGQRAGRSFQAIVDNPAGGDIALAAQKFPPFARVAREVFERLGGPFAEAARHLAAGAAPSSAPVSPTGVRPDAGQPAGTSRGRREGIPRPSVTPPPGMLQFRDADGSVIRTESRVAGADFPAGEFLVARWLELPDGTRLRQHRPVTGDHRQAGFDRLDNEILAGRRLHEVAAGLGYPAEVACLYGDEANSATPYTLFRPYLGESLREIGGYLDDDEQEAFLKSLLTGLCWLGAAGIAHRAISPDTVTWDSQRRRAQITDFSRSMPFGAPRTPITGSAAWVPRELRPETCYGLTGPAEDVWAAARLIYHVRSGGEDMEDSGQLSSLGLSDLLDGVFGPPEGRPTPQDLLARLKASNPAPRQALSQRWLDTGRERFSVARDRKQPVPPPPATENRTTADDAITCPICLSGISDWGSLPLWKWDLEKDDYARVDIPPGASAPQRARMMLGAWVRCPASDNAGQYDHYLPVDYGRFGKPIILGFVGLTKSGKTHMLAAMADSLKELNRYGIDCHPLDPAVHDRFNDDVRPLFTHGQALPGTPQGQAGFADAYIVRHQGGPERVVALFDPAGGDLLRQGPTEEFLWIADGLFFMVDPDRQVNARQERDAAFATSLDVIRASGRRDHVSAAIILGKADKVRFEAPVERWLRAGSESLDADDFLAESADVYAYLDGQGTEGTEAFHVCGRATLHFASATGSSDEGGRFQRGVRPRRALRPLLAMLAMTGILTGPEAEEIGQ